MTAVVPAGLKHGASPDDEQVTYLFGNVGRTDHGSSVHVDTLALEALYHAAAHAGHHRVVVLLCEINEGDDNNELDLALRIFRGYRVYWRTTREPVLLSPDWPEANGHVAWVPNSSVPHWSPTRSVNWLRLPGTRTVVFGGHPAAGAYHGERPAPARGQLITSWDNYFRIHARVERRVHLAGLDVVWLEDVNRVHMPDYVIGEHELFADVTDHGRVLPAAGRAAKFASLPRIDFRVDSHDGHGIRGHFHDAA